MQTVKSKMLSLKGRLEEAMSEAEKAEQEYKEIETKTQQLEQLYEDKNTELATVEDKLDALESKLQSVTDSLISGEKGFEEGLQARKTMENRAVSDARRIVELEAELKVVTEEGAAVTAKFDLVAAENMKQEEELDELEERIEVAEARVKELEAEVTIVGNSLRSMEMAEGQANSRSESGNVKIADLEKKVAETEKSAVEHEEKSSTLEEKTDAADENLTKAKDAYNEQKREYDSLVAEICEI